MTDYIIPFSNKIKLLRTTYDLSLSELSTIISLKNHSSLYAWENQNSSPLFENMISLSTFFGVSLDWLAGYSQQIYTPDSVRAGERWIYEQLKQNIIAGKIVSNTGHEAYLQVLQDLSHQAYLSYDTGWDTWQKSRRTVYALAVRANITVLLRMVPLADIYWAEAYLQNGRKKRGVLATTKSRLALLDQKMAESYKEPGKKAKERAINLVNLLQPAEKGIKSQPVYDVIAACESSHS